MEFEEIRNKINRLRKLEKKATKGPWFQWTRSGDISSKDTDAAVFFPANTTKEIHIREDGSEVEYEQATKENLSDIKFVIEMRNQITELLDMLEYCHDRINYLEQHGPNCECRECKI